MSTKYLKDNGHISIICHITVTSCMTAASSSRPTATSSASPATRSCSPPSPTARPPAWRVSRRGGPAPRPRPRPGRPSSGRLRPWGAARSVDNDIFIFYPNNHTRQLNIVLTIFRAASGRCPKCTAWRLRRPAWSPPRRRLVFLSNVSQNLNNYHLQYYCSHPLILQ